MADADNPEVVRPDEVVSCPPTSGSAWDGTTSYRVTDLCLFSDGDLTALAAALAARGLVVSGGPRWLDIPEYSRLAEPHWYCQFQARCEDQRDHPEPELARLAAAGGVLRLTLYALDPREIKHAEPGAAADGRGM